MHIPPFDNKNLPIVDINDSRVPLNYLNIVNLQKDQSFEFKINQTTNNMDSTFTQHQNLENKRSNPPVQIDLHAADEENINW